MAVYRDIKGTVGTPLGIDHGLLFTHGRLDRDHDALGQRRRVAIHGSGFHQLRESGLDRFGTSIGGRKGRRVTLGCHGCGRLGVPCRGVLDGGVGEAGQKDTGGKCGGQLSHKNELRENDAKRVWLIDA